MKKLLLVILLLIFAGCDEINKYVTIVGTTEFYVLSHQFENGEYYDWTNNDLPNGSGLGWREMLEGWQSPPMRPNVTGAGAFYVACDSAYYGTSMHQEFISPVIDCSIYPPATYQLNFDMNFQSAGLGENVLLRVWDGFNWVQLDYWDTSSVPIGEHKSYDITAYANGNPYFQIGFEYDSNLQVALYFQVDNVRVKLTINN